MKNINKNGIVLALFVMVFAMFVSMFVAASNAKADIIAADRYGNVTYEYDPVIPNPRPAIFSVNPNPITAGSGAVTITIVGDEFVNGAVAKVNNFDRSTSFGSKTRLTVELTASDTARAGDKVITVYNPGPGGGLSNAIVLSIVPPSSASVSTGSVAGASASKTTKKVVTAPKGEVLGDEDCVEVAEVEDEDYGDLAAGAIVGDGGFFPGSLVGWLLLVILILLLVIIIRRMLGAENRYHDTPLKHA